MWVHDNRILPMFQILLLDLILWHFGMERFIGNQNSTKKGAEQSTESFSRAKTSSFYKYLAGRHVTQNHHNRFKYKSKKKLNG